MAVDYFSSQVPDTLVMKHNGGAQAGHTVETDGKRFVFHQLSAGSFRHSDTFWTDTYYPDLFKLREEAEQFRQISGYVPNVWCDLKTNVTLVDDVLTNMLFETVRGESRHGSCGMGINECDLRTKAGFGMTVLNVLSKSAAELTKWVLDVRRERKTRDEWFKGCLAGAGGRISGAASIENGCGECHRRNAKERFGIRKTL